MTKLKTVINVANLDDLVADVAPLAAHITLVKVYQVRTRMNARDRWMRAKVMTTDYATYHAAEAFVAMFSGRSDMRHEIAEISRPCYTHPPIEAVRRTRRRMATGIHDAEGNLFAMREMTLGDYVALVGSVSGEYLTRCPGSVSVIHPYDFEHWSTAVIEHVITEEL